MSVAREDRRFMVVERDGQPYAAGRVEGNWWHLSEVCLSDDMNADIAALMGVKLGDTITDHVGDKLKRVR